MNIVGIPVNIVEPQPKGWLCPRCGGAHAPDVKTCPTGGALSPLLPLQAWPSQTVDCGCPALNVCMNVACPRRVSITNVSTSGSSDNGTEKQT